MASDLNDEMKHCYENLIVVDVGANLTNKKYIRDLDSVIQRAKDSGEFERGRNGVWRCENWLLNL